MRVAANFISAPTTIPKPCARLVTFHRQTEPLVEYYRRAGLLHEVDGEGDVAGTSARSLAIVRGFTANNPAAPAAT